MLRLQQFVERCQIRCDELIQPTAWLRSRLEQFLHSACWLSAEVAARKAAGEHLIREISFAAHGTPSWLPQAQSYRFISRSMNL
jgi:hypothetical protein